MKKYILIIVLFLQSAVLSIEYPNFEVLVNNNPYQEDIFINSYTQGHQFMAILGPDLDVKWYITDINNKGWDFKVNNNQMLTYFQKPSNNIPEGKWYVMDKNMREVDTLKCTNDYEVDNHDIYYLVNGGYILEAYGREAVDVIETAEVDTAKILILQEFDSNHNLVFQWKNSDHMDIQDYVHEINLNANYLNWTHGNSIEVDHDDNIIVSNRAMSEVIKFNRTTGSVIWRLGGPMNDFTFINDTYNGPSKQHDARRLENGNILIFDNGTGLSRPSRVVEYELDEDVKRATMVWEFNHPDQMLSLNQGCAQRLANGNTLICWGTLSNNPGATITEVDSQNNIVLEIKYPEAYHSYKVRKVNWEFDVNLIVGDLNLDSLVNILDIISSINLILNVTDHDPFDLFKADINRDGKIDILDIIQLVNSVLED